MFRHSFFILTFISCLFLTACWNHDQQEYLGRWDETSLSFTPHIQHIFSPDQYYHDLLGYKYAGHILPPWEQERIAWMKHPRNLKWIFNTVKAVGMEKIVSQELYHTQIEWGVAWEGQSLNEVVSGYLQSDTSGGGEIPYYNEFWARRRQEGNLALTYQIFSEVHEFYNDGFVEEHDPVNDTLATLIRYNHELLTSPDEAKVSVVRDYFNYLKSVGLEHSAYELASYQSAEFDNVELALDSDSLIRCLTLDTIPEEEWKATKYNASGWIDYESVYEGP